jgi:surface-anchored protein
MVASGASNPGNFVLFNDAGTIRLSATGSTIGTGSFTLTASHLHWNWGFSESGIYTFDMQASYTDPLAGVLLSPVETYTFQVVPEPSTWALAGGVVLCALGLRRRVRRRGRFRRT